MSDNCREWCDISRDDTKQKRTGKIYKPVGAYFRILDLLYPPVCPFCGKIEKEGICLGCRKKIRYIETEFCRDCRKHSLAYTQGKSLWLHREPVSHAIYQFKYHNKRVYAKVFAEELAKRYGRQVYKWKIEEILPIPLHPSKQKKRGFNQAELLGREIGKTDGDSSQYRGSIPRKKDKAAKKIGWQGTGRKYARRIRSGKSMEGKEQCPAYWWYLYDRKHHTYGGKNTEKGRSPKCLLFDYKHWTRALSVCYTKNDVLI